MDSRTIIKMIEADGWYRVAQSGSHAQFTHATRPGKDYGAYSGEGYAPVDLGEHREAIGREVAEVQVSKVTYIAAICGRDGSFGVVFPDFMGCVSAGETLAEATAMAHEALQLHVEGMVEDGDTLPPRTSPTLEQVAASFNDPDDPIDERWVRLIEVTVSVPDRDNTVQLRVKADLVQRIADLATVTSTKIDSRRFIEEAVEHEIERYRKTAA